jgi:type I restriction enzyme, S subunit
MAVNPSYKMTEVGEVPADWKVATLGGLCQTSSGTTPARAQDELYYRNGSIPWVKTMDLGNTDLVGTSECVTESAIKQTSLQIYPVGTVLVAMYGGFQQIGRTGLLRIPAAVNQAIVAVQPATNALLPEYLLGTLNYRIEYWKSVASSSRKDPNITSQDVRNFPIAYPPLPEQRAIASALSDVDALIAALDRLIAKKRDIKQAVTQQLLTGRTRLPGFSGEWEVTILGDTCDFENGDRGTNYPSPKSFVDSGIPFVNAGHVEDGLIQSVDLNYITRESYNRLGGGKVRPGDILFCLRGSLGKFGVVSPGFGEGAIASSLVIVRPKPEWLSIQFLVCFFKSQLCVRMIDAWAGGAAQPNLGVQDLARFELFLPPLLEQTAIAAVLSDMDAELAALEARRDKTRALKQGMMQELLTGRTRLV